MEVKCEYSETGGICHVNLAGATTQELTTELEKRRPCLKCRRNGSTKCNDCLWSGIFKATCAGEDWFKKLEDM